LPCSPGFGFFFADFLLGVLALVLLGAFVPGAFMPGACVPGAFVPGACVLGDLGGAEDPGDTPPVALEELWANSLRRAGLCGYSAPAG
jgi:hypothetical protein